MIGWLEAARQRKMAVLTARVWLWVHWGPGACVHHSHLVFQDRHQRAIQAAPRIELKMIDVMTTLSKLDMCPSSEENRDTDLRGEKRNRNEKRREHQTETHSERMIASFIPP